MHDKGIISQAVLLLVKGYCGRGIGILAAAIGVGVDGIHFSVPVDLHGGVGRQLQTAWRSLFGGNFLDRFAGFGLILFHDRHFLLQGLNSLFQLFNHGLHVLYGLAATGAGNGSSGCSANTCR